MRAAYRPLSFCRLCWGIVAILLLFCGQETSARPLTPAELSAIPMTGLSAAIQPLVPSPLRWETDDFTPSYEAALSRDRLTFSPPLQPFSLEPPLHYPLLLPLPLPNRHIPGLLEIRGMLPFSLAPPHSVSDLC